MSENLVVEDLVGEQEMSEDEVIVQPVSSASSSSVSSTDRKSIVKKYYPVKYTLMSGLDGYSFFYDIDMKCNFILDTNKNMVVGKEKNDEYIVLTHDEKIKCITVDHKTPFNTIQNFIFCSFKKLSASSN